MTDETDLPEQYDSLPDEEYAQELPEDEAPEEAEVETELEEEAPPHYTVEVTQIALSTAELPILPSTAPDLKAADADADADLARPARVSQFRALRRTQASMAIPALLLMGVGALLLYGTMNPNAFQLPTLTLIGIAFGALGLGMVMRFFFNGRRERGLFLIGLLILGWTGLGALTANGMIALEQAWPFALCVIGLAMIGVFLFERSHERGLIFPALLLLIVGGVAIPMAYTPFPPDITSLIAAFWPLLILIVALALVPRVIRPRSN